MEKEKGEGTAGNSCHEAILLKLEKPPAVQLRRPERLSAAGSEQPWNYGAVIAWYLQSRSRRSPSHNSLERY